MLNFFAVRWKNYQLSSMDESKSVNDRASGENEDDSSSATIENARKLTERVEGLTSASERLGDPADFQVALNQVKPDD